MNSHPPMGTVLFTELLNHAQSSVCLGNSQKQTTNRSRSPVQMPLARVTKSLRHFISCWAEKLITAPFFPATNAWETDSMVIVLSNAAFSEASFAAPTSRPTNKWSLPGFLWL